MATKLDISTTASAQDQALLDLLRLLAARSYRFTTPTPATHARVVSRPERHYARSLEDVLGWSLTFADDRLDRDVLKLLRASGCVEAASASWRSRVRVSSLGDLLFLHSAYPTDERDAVFFGPDSYRFANFIRSELGARPLRGGRVADIGTGAGVGAAILADESPQAEIIATDPNPDALHLARINLAAAGLSPRFIEATGLHGISAPLDLITINPPYIADHGARAYRDGGGMHGGALSLELACEAMAALAPAGRLLLYTGSAIVDGHDGLRDALTHAAQANGCTLRYREIDPDVFGEELEQPLYADVDRIAAVGAVMTRSH